MEYLLSDAGLVNEGDAAQEEPQERLGGSEKQSASNGMKKALRRGKLKGQKQCSCVAGIIGLTPLSDCLSSSNHAAIDGITSKEWLSVKGRLIYCKHRNSYLSEILLSFEHLCSF